MDIVEFLRQRLDEDEAVARAAADPLPWLVYAGFSDDGGWEITVGPAHMRFSDEEPAAEHIARHQPARVLREVEAKRRILDKAGDFAVYSEPYTAEPLLREVVRLLALPYADHPDYRQEWKP